MAFQDVLVPTDFGPGSRAALNQAMDSLGPEGDKVTVLHVLDQHFVESIHACFPDTTPEALTTHLQNQAREQYRQLMVGMERDKVACELVNWSR
jgi:hypothetical protein